MGFLMTGRERGLDDVRAPLRALGLRVRITRSQYDGTVDRVTAETPDGQHRLLVDVERTFADGTRWGPGRGSRASVDNPIIYSIRDVALQYAEERSNGRREWKFARRLDAEGNVRGSKLTDGRVPTREQLDEEIAHSNRQRAKEEMERRRWMERIGADRRLEKWTPAMYSYIEGMSKGEIEDPIEVARDLIEKIGDVRAALEGSDGDG